MNLSSFSDATVYVGGLDDKVSEAILWELFLQAGPVGKQAMQSCVHESCRDLTGHLVRQSLIVCLTNQILSDQTIFSTV